MDQNPHTKLNSVPQKVTDCVWLALEVLLALALLGGWLYVIFGLQYALAVYPLSWALWSTP